MRTYLWASAHKPTPPQMEELTLTGQVLFLSNIQPSLQARLNNTPSTQVECEELAEEIQQLEYKGNFTLVQLGGSPKFLATYGSMLKEGYNQVPLFAHSERVSQDEIQADGSIKKVSVFNHIKFI